jgi:mannose-6-phosphate isomerase class I
MHVNNQNTSTEDLATTPKFTRGRFDTHPKHRLVRGTLQAGFKPLAAKLANAVKNGVRVLAIDGYHGVNWVSFQEQLLKELSTQGFEATWVSMDSALKQPDQLRNELAPFLGGDDPIFGLMWPLGIEPMFDPPTIASIRAQALVARGRPAGSLMIITGIGAALIDNADSVWYIDTSKEKIQQLHKEGKLRNWGDDLDIAFGAFYKRAYYIEWPAMNRHKQSLLSKIDCVIDAQNVAHPVSLAGSDFRDGLDQMTRTPFRPRPWFAPGPWGGQFMKHHMGLDPDQTNYAWSFELIAPENGILFGDGEQTLEVTFDWVLFNDSAGVMGTDAARQFGTEWPVRFDYLDTMDGGNLSVQVHPRPDYIRREFGESFTQDETYYIALADDDAKVYLGFKDETQPDAFRKLLVDSARNGTEVDVDRYVHNMPSKVHDLFIIPNGTIHCSGAGNLVLEISATPYTYTFKLYDYLRRDLNGNLRPINIDRGFDNLYWDRRSDWVDANLVAKPVVKDQGEGWVEYTLMDVPYTFYIINRVDFDASCEWETNEIGYMVNLVEGDHVEVHSENGTIVPLAYLESMVVPAKTGKVRFVNRGDTPCKLMKVFVRPGTGVTEPLNDPIG